ncbi:MAG: DUF1697 domain-containing protein [Acidobacteria bacterium]|nr:DUF1697 domain-containing protein [Acidobacteriota bacterium]
MDGRKRLAQPLITAVCLLRAVNLGGRNMIRMEALRELCTGLGFQGVATFIQSGNVVFQTKPRDLVKAASRIEDEIEFRFGFRTDAMVRTADELQSAVEANPFEPGLDPRKLLVFFLKSAPGARAIEELLAVDSGEDRVHVRGREMHVYFPGGLARPQFSLARAERILGTTGTGRNWSSVNRLLALAQE